MITMLTNDNGSGIVDYALIMVLVVIVVIIIMTLAGSQIGNVFSNIYRGL